jgi:uncharacterized protein with HEPN domain
MVMRNPNHPNRKIWHADVMRKAGFEIDEAWMNINKNTIVPSNPTGVSKLIYWKNAQGVRVVLHDYQQITLKTLVKRVYDQAVHHMKQKARIVWREIE